MLDDFSGPEEFRDGLSTPRPMGALRAPGEAGVPSVHVFSMHGTVLTGFACSGGASPPRPKSPASFGVRPSCSA